ncbi:MAG: cytidylate kinase [Crocinitomicaceae bacterium]|nr:cytidylate kinase [Crocinitomicaceae bacterium]|tara:strand:- start:3506 stop:4198 length:693 start_codon:yes stop_codon:yes gene_type:complete
MKNSLVITLDGHSACGKSTLAKLIAKEMNYKYIDTGAMYRAITFFFDDNCLIDNQGLLKNNAFDYLDKIKIGFSKLDEKGQSFVTLNGVVVESKIRNLEISNLVSEVSKHKPIRRKMVEIQQSYSSDGGLVMDGRDIGSVVFPNADIKFWVTASSKTRAKRRLSEMLDKNIKVDLKDVIDNISRRDYEDQNRKESPLIKPIGAIEIDNSNLSINQTLDLAMNHVNSLLNK